MKKAVLLKKKKKILINLENFSLENNEIQLKIFNNCIKHVSKSYYPPRARKTLNLLAQLRSNKKLKASLGGCIIQKNRNNLVIYKED